MAEEINEVVSGSEIAKSSEDIHITYFRPKFIHRVFANLIDIMIFILLFFSVFLGVREIIKINPTYKANSEELTSIKVDSGTYAYDNDGVLKDIITVLENDDAQTAKSRSVKSSKAINQFIGYVHAKSGDDWYQEITKNYREYRLSDSMKKDDIPLFVVDENDEVIENPVLLESVESVSSEIYRVFYTKAYKPYIDEKVQAYLVLALPRYKQIISYQTNVLLWGNIFSVYCFTGLLVYLLPILIFRRGRMTFGKAIYGIGLVDSRCLSPSIGRSLARFAIFYFAILILSLFTFGLPMIVSFSLMAFSKNKQGFPDYMLRLTEVDNKRTKIYLSFQEVELEKTDTHREPVKFTTKNYD